jgi:CRISPR-associated endonuclease/helicase Cas3
MKNEQADAYSEIKKEFIARRRERDGKTQDLWQHLKETSYLARQFASKIGLEKYGEIIGLLHDLGKASLVFDKYIRSATGLIDQDDDEYVDVKEKKGKIDHSSSGAQFIHRYFSCKDTKSSLALQIMSLIIVSHHSGLIDCITPDGYDNYSRRMNKPEEKTRTEESLSNIDESIIQKIEEILCDETFISHFNYKLKSLQEKSDSTETYIFKVGLLTRFLFSCLIDADRLSTADFEFPDKAKQRKYGKYEPWPVLIKRLDMYLRNFESNSNKIDVLRQEISNCCLNFSERPKGLYQLNVPTGGGKTLSSLRFALNHANKHNMDRVIYIVPYTSIIDQNAQKAREALEVNINNITDFSTIVLEHHSNLTPEEESTQQKILSENWDAPVVFTTMVKFLEALFGYGTRSPRRMHQLANAVLIFDEIQTLPVRCVHLFNVAIRFLIKGCGSTVVICTATQPLLDKVVPEQRALQITPEQQMVPDVKGLFKELKRVDVYDRRKIGGWTEHEVADHAKEELDETGSVLIVVNTKKAAKSLFQILHNQSNADVFHLSTNMCPAHRMEVLERIKKCLPYTKPVICISTQLIEAGVDIDFGSVIRYLAGLDSIAQSAGRCNRNGTRQKKGRVFIINPCEENLDKLEDIKIGRDKAERVLEEFKAEPKQFDEDVLGLKAIERYYHYYFHDRKEEMCYKVGSNSVVGRSDNLFDLLSINPISVKEYQRINASFKPRVPLNQSFMTAAKAFQAIDSFTRGVIVPYGAEGKRIIDELCASYYLEKQYKLLKEAQRFSVNVFPYMLEKLSKQQIIHEVQRGAGILYLDKHYYSDTYGISESPVNEMEILIIEEA